MPAIAQEGGESSGLGGAAEGVTEALEKADETNQKLVEQVEAAAGSQTTEEATSVTVDPGVLPDNPIYFIDQFVDDVRLTFTPEEQKAQVATEIHDERIAETQALVENGVYEAAVLERSLGDAGKKIEIVQQEITPELHGDVTGTTKNSIDVLKGVKENVPEAAKPAIDKAINRQLVKEKKTEVVAEITLKINQLCRELIELVGLEEAIASEPRCDPDMEKSPKWLKRKAKGEYKELDEQARKKFIDEMGTCFDDPRACRCSEIPVKSFSNACNQIIPQVIRCTYEQDEQACERMEEISRDSEAMFEELPPDLASQMEGLMEKKQSESFEKFAPKECVAAGAKTRDSCMEIMMDKFMPPECKAAGARTREACEKVMTEKYGAQFGGAPSECTQDGKFIGSDACQQVMFKKFAPQECISAGVTTADACAQIMQQQGEKQRKPPSPESFKQLQTLQQNVRNVPRLPAGAEAGVGAAAEIPAGIVFKDGEAIPINQEEIDEAVETAEEGVEEIDLEEATSDIEGDLTELESGVEAIDQASAEEVAEAIEGGGPAPEGGEQAPSEPSGEAAPAESAPAEAPAESAPAPAPEAAPAPAPSGGEGGGPTGGFFALSEFFERLRK